MWRSCGDRGEVVGRSWGGTVLSVRTLTSGMSTKSAMLDARAVFIAMKPAPHATAASDHAATQMLLTCIVPGLV